MTTYTTTDEPVEGVSVEVEHVRRITVRVHAPEIPQQILRNLLDELPNDATVAVQLMHGGSQREPVVTGYILTADLLPKGVRR